jgi:TM2 domain-containing membrane protein YozV
MQQAQPITIFCSRCGQSMAVAPEHMNRVVGCPHCSQHLEPWRVAAAGAVPPPLQAGAAYYPAGYSSRSKVVAGVLGILLGGLGIHRFYMGYIGIGILQILVTICTSGVGHIWGLVEGILCLTGNMRDVDGRPLRD